MTRRFVTGLERFPRDQGIDLVSFSRGERKDDVTQKYLRGWSGGEGIGKAREKARVLRAQRRVDPVMGTASPELIPGTAMVNASCIYLVDDDFGPCLVKNVCDPNLARVRLHVPSNNTRCGFFNSPCAPRRPGPVGEFSGVCHRCRRSPLAATFHAGAAGPSRAVSIRAPRAAKSESAGRKRGGGQASGKVPPLSLIGTQEVKP